MDKNFVGVKEMAANMNVSEKTVYRMLNDDQFPFAVKIGGQWRFRKDAVSSWIQRQSKTNAKDKTVDHTITCTEAIQNGAVLFRIHGCNRDEALDALLTSLPYNPNFDPAQFKLSVLMRESLASTCLDGISCMTPSTEYPIFVDKSLVILAFLEERADFKALDNILAQAIFLIIGANSGEQFLLETRLRRLFMEKMFKEDLLSQPGRQELIQLIQDWENKLFAKHQK